MVKFLINNKEYISNESYTILQFCLKNAIEIPRFCFHERLSIAGNCRMCLVEMKKSLKPIASCAVSITEDMVLFTDTILVKKARENVLEFLLSNHPLDCPICDQGGECDLQDQAMIFGGDRGRFYENKRASENKICGPIVKTIMTRCIHCTRCIRYLSEITGLVSFGTTGRGNEMEIGTYIESSLLSELSGNLIDLCPVGALTSKPYWFRARPWELISVESIDIFDSLGSNIRIDLRGQQIMRVLPIYNKFLNDWWITDKVRYFYDALEYQRFNSVILKKNRNWYKISWLKSFCFIKQNFQWNITNYICGNYIESELVLLLKKYANTFGSSNLLNDNKLLNLKTILDYRIYLNDLNKLRENHLYLLINSNLRLESPILNTEIRKSFINLNALIFSFNTYFDMSFSYKQVGLSLNLLKRFFEGKLWICKLFSKSTKACIVLGQNILNRIDNVILLIENLNLILKKLNLNWQGFSFIFSKPAILSIFELGFINGVNQFNILKKKK